MRRALGMIVIAACGSTGDAASPSADAPFGTARTSDPRVVPCAPGEWREADGTCAPAGIAPASCGAAFVGDGARGCLPVLPDAPCAAGEVAWLGERSCHPIAPCGAPPWGDVPADAAASFVDASAAATGAPDGSRGAPWTTIGDAVAHAADGATIAVAAGNYRENVVIDGKTVHLVGVCPARVAIDGGAGAGVAVHAAPGTTIRGVSVAGRDGITIASSDDVGVTEVAVTSATYTGVAVDASARFAARALVVGHAGNGIAATVSDVTLDHVSVTALAPGPQDTSGLCIDARGPGATLAVRGAVLAGCPDTGISVYEASLDASDVAIVDSTNGLVSEVSTTLLRRIVVARSGFGFTIADGSSDLDTITVRDALAMSRGVRGGFLLEAGSTVDGAYADARTLARHLVVHEGAGATDTSTFVGIVARIAGEIDSARVDMGTVLGTAQARVAVTIGGDALVPEITLDGVAVLGAATVGFAVAPSSLHLASALVRGGGSGGGVGDGIVLQESEGRPPSLVVDHTSIAGVARAGLAAFGGGTIVLTSTAFDDDPIDIDFEPIQAGSAAFADHGGNVCRTAGVPHACQIASAGLTAPAGL